MKSFTNGKFQPVLSWTLLLLTFVVCQFLGAVSMATPVVTAGGHFTDRRGPHSLPSSPVGDFVQLFVFLDSSDPIGSPTISVEASQGGTKVTLDPIPAGSPLFPPHGYFKFIDFEPDLAGSWVITATDSTGGASALLPPIAEPEFLPLVEGVTLQGTALGATVSWTVPDLTGFDVDGVNVRLITASGSPVWQSITLPPQTTSVTAPAGELQLGVDYVYAINLVDAEGENLDYIENISRAYSTPFFYSVPGDFNEDGTVNSADYVVWRNGLGTAYEESHYEVWRAHFGQSIGSGAAGYTLGASAAPPSTGVPEPASAALSALMTAGLGQFMTGRRRRVLAR